MKTKLLITLTAVLLFLIPASTFCQTINLGTSANFVLFTTTGAVGNTGISQLTGNVGTNVGSSTGFGNVNGVMHDNDGASATCASDLLLAYNQTKDAVSTASIAPLIGNGAVLAAGVYAVPSNATLSATLTLDANNNPNAVFIFQIAGTLSTGVNSKVLLVNGASASNVYWKVEGLVSMAAGTSMKGTVIANNAAVAIGSGATLEGRALSIGGAVNVTNVLGYTPVVAGSPLLTGPAAPVLATTANYGLFTANGSLINSGISNVKGDVGTNVGLTTGFNALTVTGAIHPIPDGNTSQCGADLLVAYNALNLLTADIELLYPAQFGRNLVLTPHTYIMKGSVALTDSLYLNAMGNADAVFVIQVNGAFATSTHSKVLLINGTQAKNVYWKVEGAVTINDYSIFRGTIICNNGAVLINTGATIYGRALTTNGNFATADITVLDALDISTAIVSPKAVNTANTLTIAPNPFSSYTTVALSDESELKNYKLIMYNVMGKEVMNTTITNQLTTLNTSNLQSGIYFYKVMDNDKMVQSGKLISNQ